MTDIIDISVLLRPGMPTWPGSVGIRLMRTMRLEAGDSANVSRLDCDVHMGTHIEAPLHYLENGYAVEQIPLESLIGPAIVVNLSEVDTVTSNFLANLSLPSSSKRLLLRTKNSELWASGVTEFREDFVALTDDAARWVVEKGIHLIGVDYLSIQRYGDSPLTHKILLEAGVIILEGLNLADVQPGIYELICLPLRLIATEAAPARVVLRHMSDINNSLKNEGQT